MKPSHHAYWTFSARIITPTIERLLPEPEKAHAVEIGYGDGALLTPAAGFFGRVTGVSMGQGDADMASIPSLINDPARDIPFAEWRPSAPLPFDDGSIDFIYSLRGVRRLPDLAAFKSLAADCARVLRPGGVAMLWFGRLSRLPFAPPGKTWLRGYDVRTSPDTGEPTLCLRMFHARRAVLAAGMKAVSLSTPLHPDTSWRLFRGGSLSYITAWKPGRS
jgi:SAM-dependent methyltransferase